MAGCVRPVLFRATAPCEGADLGPLGNPITSVRVVETPGIRTPPTGSRLPLITVGRRLGSRPGKVVDDEIASPRIRKCADEGAWLDSYGLPLRGYAPAKAQP